MIKVFTLNKNGKIELNESELKKLLDEAYWDGYRNGNHTTYTYRSPSWEPYTITYTSATGVDCVCNGSSISSSANTLTIKSSIAEGNTTGGKTTCENA